jgi:hypothetical protein
VTKVHSTKTRQSPRGLIESSRRDLAWGEHGFEFKEIGAEAVSLQAPASLEMVRSLGEAMRDVARDAITAEGLDPDDWRMISSESDEADQACIAAKLLGRLGSMDRYLAALDTSHDVDAARLAAHAAVKEALSAAWLFNALGIVEHEVGIVARAQSLAGARRGGAKKAEQITERNKAVAAEYVERRKTSRKSKTALMQEVGAKHGLSRSAAVEAIKDGLKISSR